MCQQLGIVTGAYTRFSCTNPTTRDFLYSLYLALDDNKLLKPLCSGLRKVIKKTTFSSARVGLPLVEEQKRIEEHINTASAEIDARTSRTRRQIDLMNEHRTRLIADVVTGQLDVRETVENLPDPRGEEQPVQRKRSVSDSRSL